MARIRTIKPEFFTSEDIVELDPLARLLYIALWCEADKEGRLAWKPKTFKMRYLPGDACSIEEVCDELIDAGLVRLYGNGLAYIPTFLRHQHINPRESVSALPAPEDCPPSLPKRVTSYVRADVFDRDGHACVRCGSKEKLTLDHILPQSMGGPHIQENLRCMCKSCNSGRPVSGQALREDLARDGFTVEGLRVKFGIDASPRVATRAYQDLTYREEGRKEGKGKEGTKDKEANASVTSDEKQSEDDAAEPAETPGIPKCPIGDIVNAYHDLMPMNPRVKVLSDARKRSIAARWREASKLQVSPFGYSTVEEGVLAWKDFFEVCAASPFLTGRTKPRPGQPPFLADIDFLMSPHGFTSTIENKYHREAKE